MTKEQKDYLDKLGKSGKINMYAAVPYLESKFLLNKSDARKVLVEWMESFKN